MDFAIRKFPYGAGLKLTQVPISEIQPFALVVSPAYALLRQNAKYVAVKAPLDFFTPEDLKRLESLELIFYTEFRENVLPFQNVARSVRSLLAWRPEFDAHPVAPYERSDGVTRLLSGLWAKEGVIEPFFAAVFVDEMCGPLPGEILRQARNRSLAAYDLAILQSSVAVLLAVHLGSNDLAYLAGLRLQVFMGRGPREILEAARDLVPSVTTPQITHAQIEGRQGDFGRLGSKLSRIHSSILQEVPVPSIRGERGFLPG